MSGIDIEGVLREHGGWMCERVGDGWRCWCGVSLLGYWPAGGVTPRDTALGVAHRAHVAAVLREHLEGALAEARFMGKADAMAEVLDPQGPIWNRMHGDGWDERDRARATYPDPHPDDCMGWEDCDCATYPNPYRAAHLSDTERAGGAG